MLGSKGNCPGIHGVSPERGRESTVKRICEEKVVFQPVYRTNETVMDADRDMTITG